MSKPTFAVVDVGSKSVRLLVARRLSAAAFEVVDEERIDARLGEGQLRGDLSPEAIERGARALRVMAQVAESYDPDLTLAVGTEALRRANNARDLLARIRDETGLDVRILSEEEEAFASYLGTINATGLADGVLVDIGGGSLEVMRVLDRSLQAACSVPLGAIYATERYFDSDPPSSKQVRALRKAVRAQVGDILAGSPVPALWATGGSARNLARMARIRAGYPMSRLHGYTLARRALRRLVKELCGVPQAERRRIAGMNGARAGTLPAAAVVLDEVVAMAAAESLNVSGQGLREGLLWQLLRGDRAILPDVRAASIEGLALANGVDLAGAEPEALFAGEIFETTAPLHGLGHAEFSLVASAARLAEIGMHIDYYNRDRHAEYLVHSGDLHGFSHREIVLLAAIVRHSSGGSPDLSPYRAVVADGDEALVGVLASMLGVARAAYRRQQRGITGFAVALEDRVLHLALEAPVPPEAEMAALERPLRRLESALGVEARVSYGGATSIPAADLA